MMYSQGLVIFTLQFSYIIVKFIGVRAIVGDSLTKRLFITTIASSLWLLATSLGVKEMIMGNYGIALYYTAGNLAGVYVENLLRRFI